MPLDDLVQVIETVRQRIHAYGHALNETQTRMALIDPLLTSLGWDVSDPGIVTPEYRTDVGWADYALRGPGNKVSAVIEAKRYGSFVENHLDQMVGYCISQDIAYAAVTDGNEWQLYRTFDPVPPEEKRVLNVRISVTPPHECALQFLLLWRPNLDTGMAIPANEPVLVPEPVAATETPPSSIAPVAIPSLQESGIPEGWTNLPGFVVEVGSKPPQEIRFADGSMQEISVWRHIEERTVQWLWEKGLLTRSNLPVSSSKKRYIVALTAQHPTGSAFKYSVKVDGTPLFIEGNISSVASYRNSVKLLEHCGQDCASVLLRPN